MIFETKRLFPYSNNSMETGSGEVAANGKLDHEKSLDFIMPSSGSSLNLKPDMVVSTISSLVGADVIAVSVTTATKVQLKRKIGLVSCIGIVVGSMIGSGIFIAPKLVLRGSGSVGLFLIIWVVTGILSLFGGLCFIELGCLIPKSGGEYTYIMEAFGPMHKFFGPLPAFLYSYSRNLALAPSSFAVTALGFGLYVTQPFYPDGEVPEWLPKVVAASCVVVVAVINSTSVKLSLWIQNIFAAVKVIALVVIIIAGLVKLGQGHTENLATGFKPFGNGTSLANIASAIYSCFWSFAGWSSLNISLEEVCQPSLNLPRAISFGIPLVTVLYLMANVAYLTVMTPLEILTSNAVAVTFANRVLGVMAWIVPFSVACSTFGAATGGNFANARVFHASARKGHMIKAFSYISISRSTPLPPVLLQASIALFMIAVGGITSLIDYMSFIGWFFLAMSFSSLLVFRVTKKNEDRPFKVPIVLPILMILVAITLLILPIALKPQLQFLYAVLTISTGVTFYIPFIYYKKPVYGLNVFSRLMISCCRIAPPETIINTEKTVVVTENEKPVKI